jgi:type I restriction enzyme S subunit
MTIEHRALSLGILPAEDRWKVSQVINEVAPAHWARVRLREVASVQNGYPFESVYFNQLSGMPLIRIRDVGQNDTGTFYSGPFDNAYVVRSGDILVGMDGEFRCRRWRGRPGLLNQRVCRISFTSPEIDERFALLLLQPYLSAVQHATSSLTVAHLSSKTVEEIELLLPPRAEQERVVAKIEDLTARTRLAKEALDAVPPLLDQLRRSILAAAFRGDLTADWRAKNPNVEAADERRNRICVERRNHWEAAELDKLTSKGRRSIGDEWKDRYVEPLSLSTGDLPELPASWGWVRAEEGCEFITKGTTPASDKMYEGAGPVPFIKVYNLTFTGALDFTVKPTFVDESTHRHELARSRVFPGDVLMNIVGPPLGKVSLVPRDYPEWNINQAIAVFRPLPGLLREFLCFALLDSSTTARAIGQAKATAGQSNLTLEICRDLPLPLPPEEEQREIVRRLNQALGRLDVVRNWTEASRESLVNLNVSILAKAFSGQLVQQDPSDEPASLLLKRIGAARDSHGSTNARSRRRTPDVPKELAGGDSADLHEEIFAALWARGPLEKDQAVHRAAEHLRQAGRVAFQRLQSGGPLYDQIVAAIDSAAKAGRLDRPKRGQVRACKRDATAYTPDDWRHAMVSSLGREPVDREDAIRSAAEWARDNMGLEFTRLRANGHIAEGLRSAINSAIRRGEVTRHGAKLVAKAPTNGQLTLAPATPANKSSPSDGASTALLDES